MLKYIALGFFIFISILFLIALMQPDEFRVSRSLAIKASPEKIFPEINNLRAFNSWNPWSKMDPKSVETFEGPDEGVGAKLSWQSDKMGKGSMLNIVSRPHEFVQYRMEFIEPFKATHTAEFTLNPESNGTVVTWTMYGEKDFLSKVIGLVMSMDTMIGGPFEDGLNKLKEKIEKGK